MTTEPYPGSSLGLQSGNAYSAFHKPTLMPGCRDGHELHNEDEDTCGGGGDEIPSGYVVAVNAFLASSSIQLVSPCLSLYDPESLFLGGCQLTSKVANRSQLLSSDVGTYNLSSFVVCRAENTAKPAGRVCHWSLEISLEWRNVFTYTEEEKWMLTSYPAQLPSS